MNVWKLVLLPLISVAVATGVTWILWRYVQPSVTPLFFVAVMTSSLYGGLAAGLLATTVSGASIAFFFMVPPFSLNIGTDDVFRLATFAAVALLTNSIAAKRNRAEARQRQLIEELSEANGRIKTLSDLLPICPHCKRVRSGADAWLPLERFVDEAQDLQLSHALCPECAKREYPEFHQPNVFPSDGRSSTS